ncbi:MAG: homoaconitate hydratase [Candidatus Thermoplasmatota archaeon]|nr:homoaconitate hydratase [Euryarchaeota archaeon]MBU4032927.1 homoaconitate hydratase [Candidatus Thermoplasmatota archaeon]MBU4070965.1 homoaconitate hydratase [Candidatus Thermoplasmatota archaeon]MBU4144858.1 homoaconitate hydratase [Candidatus Thermoplasmatota archaeon]MBU4592171.1 homoaconitate hydratase [Candidatus Thermoplasmatota archaeon]
MGYAALSNFNAEGLASRKLPEKVIIYDSTLRDGEQMPGVAFKHEEKLKIARMLAEIGIPQIEAGFPAVSLAERNIVREIVQMGLGSEILALSRACIPDIDAAIDCDVDLLMLFTATSDIHLEHKYRMTREQQLDKVTEALEYAKSRGIKFSFSTEDSTRTEYDYLVEISALAEKLGARRIGISDTTGCITPTALGALVNRLSKEFKVPFSVHLHNDFGLALANALASIENGATAVATTINGMGERAGNVPTEALAIALEKMYGIKTGIDLSGLTRVCRQISLLAGVPISKNHPWVGENVFRHESGIHVAAILSEPSTYECIPPGTVGGTREIVLGKHSGKVSLKHRLDILDLQVSEEELGQILTQVKDTAQGGGFMDDAVLRDIVQKRRK